MERELDKTRQRQLHGELGRDKASINSLLINSDDSTENQIRDVNLSRLHMTPLHATMQHEPHISTDCFTTCDLSIIIHEQQTEKQVQPVYQPVS